MEIIQLGLRALQLLWTLLITALIGNVISLNINGPMATVNFTMFVAVLSWLSALYGIAASVIESLAIPIVLLALDGAATLFTLIDAIVLAATLKAVNCAGDNNSQGDSWPAWGSNDTSKRCREIQASTTFMWFLWATITAALLLTFMAFRRTGGSVRSGGGPHMTQVGGV